MSILQSIGTAILIATSIVLIHYIDNSYNARQEKARYYYKRVFTLSLIVWILLQITQSNTTTKGGGYTPPAYSHTIQTGSAPF